MRMNLCAPVSILVHGVQGGDRLAWGFRLCLLLFVSGCVQPNAYQKPDDPTVIVAPPVQQAVTSYVEQTGNMQASERVELRTRVAGYLVQRNFEDGDFVKAGQVLFVIDEEPFRVRLQLANAKLAEADANLKKARQSKAREIADSQLRLNESDLQLARLTHERSIGLLDQNATSRQEFDRSEAALRKAQAQLLSNRAELEQANADYETNILVAASSVELAKSEVRTAEIDLGYCRLSAPIDGLIDRRSVDVGNYVKADSDNVLASIVRVNPIYAYVSISEDELLRIKTKYRSRDEHEEIPVLMSIGENRKFNYRGKVDYISPSVATGSGTVQIRGVFENSGLLMPGMFVRVRVPSEVQDDALLVSERSLGYDQVGAFLYVVNAEGIVERRTVTLGDVVDGMRVVSGKITVDDQVIVDGLLKVRPDMKVKPKLATVEAAPAATPEIPAAAAAK